MTLRGLGTTVAVAAGIFLTAAFDVSAQMPAGYSCGTGTPRICQYDKNNVRIIGVHDGENDLVSLVVRLSPNSIKVDENGKIDTTSEGPFTFVLIMVALSGGEMVNPARNAAILTLMQVVFGKKPQEAH